VRLKDRGEASWSGRNKSSKRGGWNKETLVDFVFPASFLVVGRGTKSLKGAGRGKKKNRKEVFPTKGFF